MRRATSSRAFCVGGVLVGLVVAFAVLGPWLTGDPNFSDFSGGIGPGGGPRPPSAEYWFGTDRIFRDQLARLAAGARLSLIISVFATAIAMGVGSLVGLVAGWNEGRALDTVLMRAVDIGLSFPFLLLVMAIGSALDKTSALTVTLTLGFTGWLGTARLVRAKTLQLREAEYVLAAKVLGQTTPRILFRHIAPNISGPVLVLASLSVGQMMLAEAVLSYLGVGIAPPTATWGHMLYESQDYYGSAPWLVLAPSAALVLSVLGFNLLGEGLRHVAEPHT